MRSASTPVATMSAGPRKLPPSAMPGMPFLISIWPSLAFYSPRASLFVSSTLGEAFCCLFPKKTPQRHKSLFMRAPSRF